MNAINWRDECNEIGFFKRQDFPSSGGVKKSIKNKAIHFAKTGTPTLEDEQGIYKPKGFNKSQYGMANHENRDSQQMPQWKSSLY